MVQTSRSNAGCTGSHLGCRVHGLTPWLQGAWVHTLVAGCTSSHLGCRVHGFTPWLQGARAHTLVGEVRSHMWTVLSEIDKPKQEEMEIRLISLNS